MNTPTNNKSMTTQRFRQPVLRLMRLRELIVTLLLINIAAADSDQWTLVVQDDGLTDRLQSMVSNKPLAIKTFHYSTNDGWLQKNGILLDDHFKFGDKVVHDEANNRVRLQMCAKGKGNIFNCVNDRWIYYLDRDGPRFMKFLIDHEAINGTWTSVGSTIVSPLKSFTMDSHIKRGQWKKDGTGKWLSAQGKDDSVIGYAVTVMKDDWKTFNPEMREIRVHMNIDHTIKYFEIYDDYQQCNFEIVKITKFDEAKKRIYLQTKKAYKDKDAFTEPQNRWLYFDDTSPVFGSSESKRFFFLLIEHYLFNSAGVEVFAQKCASDTKTWLGSQKEEVKDWITAHCDCALGKWVSQHPGTDTGCRKCNNTGKVPGWSGWSTNPCGDCNGTGEMARNKGEKLMCTHQMERCNACSMTGTYNPRPTYGLVNASLAKEFKILSGINTRCPKCHTKTTCNKTHPKCLCPEVPTCPVCGGEGIVDADFDYSQWNPQHVDNAGTMPTCRRRAIGNSRDPPVLRELMLKITEANAIHG